MFELFSVLTKHLLLFTQSFHSSVFSKNALHLCTSSVKCWIVLSSDPPMPFCFYSIFTCPLYYLLSKQYHETEISTISYPICATVNIIDFKSGNFWALILNSSCVLVMIVGKVNLPRNLNELIWHLKRNTKGIECAKVYK